SHASALPPRMQAGVIPLRVIQGQPTKIGCQLTCRISKVESLDRLDVLDLHRISHNFCFHRDMSDIRTASIERAQRQRTRLVPPWQTTRPGKTPLEESGFRYWLMPHCSAQAAKARPMASPNSGLIDVQPYDPRIRSRRARTPVESRFGKNLPAAKAVFVLGVWRRVYIKDDHCFSQVVSSRASFFVLC